MSFNLDESAFCGMYLRLDNIWDFISANKDIKMLAASDDKSQQRVVRKNKQHCFVWLRQFPTTTYIIMHKAPCGHNNS